MFWNNHHGGQKVWMNDSTNLARGLEVFIRSTSRRSDAVFFFFFAFAAVYYIPKVAGVSDTKKAFLRMCTADLQISHAGRITLSNLKHMNLFVHLYLYISFLHLQKIIIFSLDNVNTKLSFKVVYYIAMFVWDLILVYYKIIIL